MLQHFDEHSAIPIMHPKCQSITSTKFPLKPLRMDGWESVDRNDKRSFEATVPGSEIVSCRGEWWRSSADEVHQSFNVNVDSGMLGIYFWMTSQFRR